jgi:hypothetical protein
LETSSDRSSTATHSTYQEAAWEFEADDPGGEWDPLPLSVVRFDPRVDARNQAPSGTVSLLPVRVEPQPGSAAVEGHLPARPGHLDPLSRGAEAGRPLHDGRPEPVPAQPAGQRRPGDATSLVPGSAIRGRP